MRIPERAKPPKGGAGPQRTGTKPSQWPGSSSRTRAGAERPGCVASGGDAQNAPPPRGRGGGRGETGRGGEPGATGPGGGPGPKGRGGGFPDADRHWAPG